MYSICIKCGNEKHEYFDKCGICNFEPESDRDIALSFILSEQILADGWQTGEFNFPRDKEELQAIANLLTQGESYVVEDKAINYVNKIVKELEAELSQLTWTKLFFFYLLPGIIAFGFVIYLISIALIVIFKG